MSSVHIPVMTDQVLELFKVKEPGVFLDCTLGGGGHTRALLDSHPENKVFACDRDADAVTRAELWSGKYEGRLSIHKLSFSELTELFQEPHFDGILADLGVSDDHLFGERGFSFNQKQPLDMRMDQASSLTADQVVNSYSEQQLTKVFLVGGLASDSRKLAKAILKARPIADTESLANLCGAVLKTSKKEAGKKRHPATLVFQAIRLEVNAEYNEIEALLSHIPALANPNARVVIICFHSGEDKLVAKKMREWAGSNSLPALWPGYNVNKALGKLLTTKAILADENEVADSPKSRSARLRCFDFI